LKSKLTEYKSIHHIKIYGQYKKAINQKKKEKKDSNPTFEVFEFKLINQASYLEPKPSNPSITKDNT